MASREQALPTNEELVKLLLTTRTDDLALLNSRMASIEQMPDSEPPFGSPANPIVPAWFRAAQDGDFDRLGPVPAETTAALKRYRLMRDTTERRYYKWLETRNEQAERSMAVTT